MNSDWLSICQQVADVLERAATLSVPEHEAIGGVFRHCLVLHGIEVEAPDSLWGFHRADLPAPNIVPEHPCHRIDDDSLIASPCQMLLECAIRTIRITDKHPQAAVDELVELRPNALVEPSDPARSAEKYRFHL